MHKIMIGEIVAAVAFYWHVRESEIMGRSRSASFVRARQCVMWLCRNRGWTCEAVAVMLDRDHTTVLYGQRAIQDDPVMLGHCSQIMRDIMLAKPCVDEVLLMCE